MRRDYREAIEKTKASMVMFGSILSLIMLATPILAVSYSITVQTDKTAYTGANAILITGKVVPAPGPNTAVFVSILNPYASPVDFGSEAVDPNTGAFSHKTVAGGTGNWTSGTYTVNATWGAFGTVVFQTATFTYSASVTTTTTTTSTTTSRTTTSTTSTATSSTSTSSTIPEFNPEALLLVSLAALGAVAVLGRSRLHSGPSIRP